MHQQPNPSATFCVAGALVVILAVNGCTLTNRPYVTSARSARSSVASRRTTDNEYDDEASEHAGPRGQSVIFGAEAGTKGTYVSGGGTATGNPVDMGATGAFYMPSDNVTTRFGVMGLDDRGIGAAGIEAGARVHTANRFSPYVGLSGAAVASGLHKGYYRYYPPNGQQHRMVTKVAGFAAVAPEAGLSYWINPSIRLNAGVNYYLTGIQPFFLVYGVGLDITLDPVSTTASSGTLRQSVASDETDEAMAPNVDSDEDVGHILAKYRQRPDQTAPPAENPDEGVTTPAINH